MKIEFKDGTPISIRTPGLRDEVWIDPQTSTVYIHEAFSGPLFVTDQGKFLVVMRDGGIEVYLAEQFMWSSTRAEAVPDEITVGLMKGPQGRVPSVDEAYEILGRFCASHFRRKDCERARISIPADTKRDDDITMMAFIESYKSLLAAHRHLELERDRLRVQLASCAVVARGTAEGSISLKLGDYGWSESYSEVRNLLGSYEHVRKELEDFRKDAPRVDVAEEE